MLKPFKAGWRQIRSFPRQGRDKQLPMIRFWLIFVLFTITFTLVSWRNVETHHKAEDGILEDLPSSGTRERQALRGDYLSDTTAGSSWIPGWVPEQVEKHLAFHLVVVTATVLPTRRWDFILAANVSVLLIDLDHVGLVINLPLASRAVHSTVFAIVVAVGIWSAGRLGLLGKSAPPLLLGVIAASVVLSHIFVDAVGADSNMPLFAPLTFRNIEVSLPAALAIQFGAILLVFWAQARGARANQS